MTVYNNTHLFETGISILKYDQHDWIDVPHDQVKNCEIVSMLPWFWPWYNLNDLSLLLPPPIQEPEFNVEFGITIVKRESDNEPYKYEFAMEIKQLVS